MANNIRPERANEFTPLIMAIDRVDASEVKRLLDEGHDPNGQDSFTYRPLHRVFEKQELSPEGLKILELLLKRGADPNATNKHDETPVHDAAFQGHANAIPLLHEYGGDIEQRGLHDRTAIHYALMGIKNAEKHLETVHALLKLGAKHTEDSQGNLPAHVACIEGRLDAFKLLARDHGEPATHQSKHGNTYLHIAAYEDMHHIAEYLHEQYPGMITKRNHANLTPYEACEDKKSATAKFLKKVTG